MNIITILRAAALLVLCFCLPAMAEVPEQSSGAIPENAVWIDVRSPGEYAGGHLAGAASIPFDGIEVGIAPLKLEKDTPIYLYCAVGGRAEIAKKRLEALNYTQVVNVGGLEDARKLNGAQSD